MLAKVTPLVTLRVHKVISGNGLIHTINNQHHFYQHPIVFMALVLQPKIDEERQ